MSALDKIRTPLDQRLRRARLGALPLLIWVAAVVSVTRLWLAGPSAPTYFGLAHAEEINVSSPVDGELDDLIVGLYQSVGAGEPVATMDDKRLLARIETARAELSRLAAEMEASRVSIEVEEEIARREADARHGQARSAASLEYPAELRAFHTDETDLQVKILETRLAITTSELEADRLEVSLRRAEVLAGHEIGPRMEVEDLAKRIDIEHGRSDGLRLLEANLEAELERSRGRRLALEASYQSPPAEVFAGHAAEARLAGWRAAIVVQGKRLEELALQRDAYVLRAPAAGRVAAVMATEGQFLLAGDPVLVIMDAETRKVAVWIPESTPNPPVIGDRFFVTRSAGDPTDAESESVVVAMSPRLEVMPQRLWRDARIAEYGRACLIGPIGALTLVPGERVRIDNPPEFAASELQ